MFNKFGTSTQQANRSIINQVTKSKMNQFWMSTANALQMQCPHTNWWHNLILWQIILVHCYSQIADFSRVRFITKKKLVAWQLEINLFVKLCAEICVMQTSAVQAYRMTIHKIWKFVVENMTERERERDSVRVKKESTEARSTKVSFGMHAIASTHFRSNRLVKRVATSVKITFTMFLYCNIFVSLRLFFFFLR